MQKTGGLFNAVLHNLKTRRGDHETIDGIVRRLAFALSDDRVNPFICGKNTINWDDFIQKQKSLVLNCRGLSRDKMIFLGSLLTGSLEAYSRTVDSDNLKPISVFLDEGVNFVTSSVCTLLREVRKFKLSLVVSIVDLNIPEFLTRSLVNCGSIVTFRVGAREASYLGRELLMKPDQLQSLSRHHVAYMLPGDEQRGTCKAPRPPIFKKFKVPEKRAEPNRTPPNHNQVFEWRPVRSRPTPAAHVG